MSAISDAVDALSAKVEVITDRAQAAIAFIQGLAQQIRDNANQPARLNELAAKLDQDAADITAAIDAGTV